MIGKALPFGKGFIGLARYLEKGAAGEERDRVEWVESRNLPTEDPETAARLMAAHARESVRTQRPVYHLVISADPGDPVDRASMSRVADTVLRELGLSEHQVLIIAHNDTDHPHMHLVVNRVHPERHRAWENSFDWPKIEKALRAEEVALGWRIVPGKHAPVPGHEPPAPALQRGDAAFLRMVQERGGPVLGRAASWAEVEEGLAAVGLYLRVKGGGLSIHDGRQEVKASDVARLFSRNNMEERLGKLSDYRRSRPARPPVAEAVRAPEPPAPAPQPVRQPEEVRPEPAPPEPRAPAPQPVRRPEEVRPEPAPPERPAPAPQPEEVRAEPAPPAPAPRPARPRENVPAAPARPEPPAPAPTPPEPRTPPVPARPRERVRSVPPAPARPAPPPSPEERFRAHLRAESDRQGALLPELVGAAELAYASRAWFAYEGHFNACVQAAENAEKEVRRLERLQGAATYDAAVLRDVLARIYTDPELAAGRLMDYQRKHGKERARKALDRVPQEFGELRKEHPWWGIGVVYSTDAAREGARRDVPDLLDNAVCSEEARPGAVTVRDARHRASAAQRALDDAREVRRGLLLPGIAEERAAALLAPLARSYGTAWVTRELARLIPPEDREAAEIAARIVSRATRGLLDRDRGRNKRGPGPGIDF